MKDEALPSPFTALAYLIRKRYPFTEPGRVAQLVGHLTRKSEVRV